MVRWDGRRARCGGEEEVLFGGGGRGLRGGGASQRACEPRQGVQSAADSPLMLMEKAGCWDGARLLLSCKADPGKVNKARRGGRERSGEGQKES